MPSPHDAEVLERLEVPDLPKVDRGLWDSERLNS
jgi:hypothetical protein